MINVGVIGYGYWGPNLVRNFMSNVNTNVSVVCDRDSSRLEKVKSLYPTIEVCINYKELINNQKIDAVIIATPVATHFELAMMALQSNKHVFIEKPITANSSDALKLIEEANKRKLVLLVDHTFVYTGAVKKMREVINSPSFGVTQYYDSTRINLGLIQSDVNVLWDLAVHDLSIMAYVLNASPISVSATGYSHLSGRPENIAFMTLFFSSSLVAHINVSWLSPVKIRQTLIGGTKQMIVYNDLEATEKIKVYDKGITVTKTADDIQKLLISYRTGDLWCPKVDESEALQVEVDHFVDCINSAAEPLTSGKNAFEIVRILEAANISIKEHGRPVDIENLKID